MNPKTYIKHSEERKQLTQPSGKIINNHSSLSVHRKIQRLFQTQTVSSMRKNIFCSSRDANKTLKPRDKYESRKKMARFFSPQNPRFRRLMLKFCKMTSPQNVRFHSSIRRRKQRSRNQQKMDRIVTKLKKGNKTIISPKKIKFDCLSKNTLEGSFKRRSLVKRIVAKKRPHKAKKQELKEAFLKHLKATNRKISSGYITSQKSCMNHKSQAAVQNNARKAQKKDISRMKHHKNIRRGSSRTPSYPPSGHITVSALSDDPKAAQSFSHVPSPKDPIAPNPSISPIIPF
ncbi:unnamed protein product [Moneuplotes crassus]|uniref:Uncharacterized protein n=1 Tax=Euplotes crassus TaxID=5936 RepID=A0AAD1X1W1_EUPCR|nr:unnamed protein product [Moneuplotes crassus]